MNALTDEKVGTYLNEYFVSSFQKVATFKIVNGQKQGGNVASYFCAPDGRVLHAVAGPIDSTTMLREAQWVVDTTKKAMAEAKDDGLKFKAYFRKAHAERLRSEYGLVIEPVTFDAPEAQNDSDALTYRDPTGRPLAPKLQLPPIEGPDVKFELAQVKAGRSPGAREILDRRGRRCGVLGNDGRVHLLMAAHSMAKIEKLYASIFEGILGEKISTKPVEVVTPFPWVKENVRRAG